MLKSRTNFKHFLQTKLANVKVLTKTKHFWPLLTFVDWNTMFRGGSKWKLDPLGPNPAFRFLTKTNCWNHKNKEIYRVNLTAKSSYFLRKKKFVDYFFSNIFFPEHSETPLWHVEPLLSVPNINIPFSKVAPGVQNRILNPKNELLKSQKQGILAE